MSKATISAAVEIIGRDGITEEEIEDEVLALVGDPLVARRLIDWVPEVFGRVLVASMGRVTVVKEFEVQDERGEWRRLPFESEPIVAVAQQRARELGAQSPNDLFLKVALRSAVASAVADAIKEGHPLTGSSIGGPSFVTLPASVYLNGQG
ncbi:hypothetical protein [Sulfuriroseicoccus oceanibius]|uniref:Uncharacterized protein n=1 Tax=Sulfuriroseicoccus oceanibius TaxID=2707525 RepID=A0A6B3L470_9BACT|nr:hypothetical protein [Sulfuriroseicoccus oceanibius]QQL45524.1 hypothetical protein G3M56_002735 [Sulfuriroseicoccus oceanibius]